MKKKEAAEVLQNLADSTGNCQPQIKLVNVAAGGMVEPVEPDGDAIKAGLIVGLLEGKVLLSLDMPDDEINYKQYVASLVGAAAEIYLQIMLDADGGEDA